MDGSFFVTFTPTSDTAGEGPVELSWHAQHAQGSADSAGTAMANIEQRSADEWVITMVPGSYTTTVQTPMGDNAVGNFVDTFELAAHPAADGECDG